MRKKRNISIICRVCLESIRKWKHEPRMWSVAFLVAFFCWNEIGIVRQICVEQNLAVSNWFFPFLFSDTMYKLFFFFGILLLFCDAPFIDNQQMLVILRSGKKNWFYGKILYVFAASNCYFLWMFFLSIVEFIPYVGFSTEWESIIEMLSINGKIGIYTVPISRNIVLQLTPILAFLGAYGVCVLTSCFLGLLIFYLNMHQKGNLGVGIALCILLLTGVVDVLPTKYQRTLLYLSPVSWTDVETFTLDYGGVPFWYAITFLCVAIVLLIILIMQKAKSYNMEAMEEL